MFAPDEGEADASIASSRSTASGCCSSASAARARATPSSRRTSRRRAPSCSQQRRAQLESAWIEARRDELEKAGELVYNLGERGAARGVIAGGASRPRPRSGSERSSKANASRRSRFSELRSLASARASSWRTRSRESPSLPPISSSVCSRSPFRPKRQRRMLRSRSQSAAIDSSAARSRRAVVEPAHRRDRVLVGDDVLHLLRVGAGHVLLEAHRLPHHALELLGPLRLDPHRLGDLGRSSDRGRASSRAPL